MKKLILLMIILAISGICFGDAIDTIGIVIEFTDSCNFTPDTLNDSSFTVGDSTLDSLFSVLHAKNGHGFWVPDTLDPEENKYVVEIETDINTNSALTTLGNNANVVSMVALEEQ